MILRFPAGASCSLAGAFVLAAALVLPPSSVSAEDAAEFSSQGPSAVPGPGMRGGAPQKGPPPGARGGSGAPRVMGGPPRGPQAAPHVGGGGAQFGGHRQQFGGPGGAQFGGSGFRGPAVGGPGWRGPGYRGHAFIRGRHHVRRGGFVLPLVGLGALSAIYVGSLVYAPYAYVDGAVGPQCSGPTDDGMCELRLTEVPLETGGAEWQCVAYCPQ